MQDTVYRYVLIWNIWAKVKQNLFLMVSDSDSTCSKNKGIIKGFIILKK